MPTPTSRAAAKTRQLVLRCKKALAAMASGRKPAILRYLALEGQVHEAVQNAPMPERVSRANLKKAADIVYAAGYAVLASRIENQTFRSFVFIPFTGKASLRKYIASHTDQKLAAKATRHIRTKS